MSIESARSGLESQQRIGDSYEYGDQEAPVVIERAALPERNALPSQFRLDIVGPNDELSFPARTLEAMVFDKKFHNTPEDMRNLYGAYETRSRFIVVTRADESLESRIEVVGVIRVISGDKPSELMTLHDLAAADGQDPADETDEDIAKFHPGFASAKVLDLGTLVVAKELRKTLVAPILYHALYKLSENSPDIEHWVTMLDRDAYAIIMSMGVPFLPLKDKGPMEYAGSSTTFPCYTRLDRVRPGFEGKGRGWEEVICDGEGLKGECDFPEGM